MVVGRARPVAARTVPWTTDSRRQRRRHDRVAPHRRAWPRPGRRRLSTDEAADPVPHPVVAPEHASTARHAGIRVPAMVTACGSSADGARGDMSRTGAGRDHAVRPQGDRCRRLPRVDGRQSPAHHAAVDRPPVLARRQLHVGHAGRRCEQRAVQDQRQGCRLHRGELLPPTGFRDRAKRPVDHPARLDERRGCRAGPGSQHHRHGPRCPNSRDDGCSPPSATT